MITNYLKIAWRNLQKNRTSSLINIVGLGIGLATFIFIMEYISLEKSVNQFHSNVDNIYRLLNEDKEGVTWSEVEPGWAQLFKDKQSAIESYCLAEQGIGQGIVQNIEKNLSFKEDRIGYASGNFFEFFTFNIIEGNKTDLKTPQTVYLSETTSKKYFGESPAIGKSLTLNNQFGKVNYSVKGIFADIGQESDIQYDMVFSLETLRSAAFLNGNGWADLNNFDSQFINLYVATAPNTNINILEKDINKLRSEVSKEDDGVTFRLQSLKNMHLGTSLGDQLQTYGNLKYIYILSAVAALILLIAWFNYINLSTAASLKRSQEVGIRKTIGASKGQLISLFLAETGLITGIAYSLAFLLVILIQPYFNLLTGKALSLNSLQLSNVWIYAFSALILATFFAGFYTAFVLSNFKPVDTLKGKLKGSGSGQWVRKGLVVSQFSFSILLIIATAVIFLQLKFMKNSELGINTDQMVVVSGPQVGLDSTYQSRKKVFLNYLGQQSFVKEYATSGSVPGKYYNFRTAGFTQPGSKPDDKFKSYAFLIISDQFLSAYGIEIKAGRNFTYQECDVEWNDNSKVLINEQALSSMGFANAEDAMQKGIQWDERHLDIIGVTADYHHTNLKNAIDPIIYYPQLNGQYYSVRLTPENLSCKLSSLEREYKSVFPGNPFEYFFTDEAFARAYSEEEQYGQIFTIASLLAIFIACLGLFGLATFVVETRTKEIGIRKVLGASVSGIVSLLSKDFVILVVISLVIAAPVAFYLMVNWLKNFEFKVEINWVLLFILVGISVVMVSLFTVAIQAIKTANAKVTKSLRAE
ncbi:MAG TPA: ABC transporter permease [Saprospiraceae bacterium]|nr:ABC transporter permease [Saprospiraceae bacterium]